MKIGEIIDRLVLIRDERKELKSRDSDLYKEYEALSEDLLRLLDEQGLPKSSSGLATASVAEQDLVAIDDFDAFEQYVYDNDALYLLQRRPAQAAIQELKKAGTDVPGLRHFTKRSINLRKLS